MLLTTKFIVASSIAKEMIVAGASQSGHALSCYTPMASAAVDKTISTAKEAIVAHPYAATATGVGLFFVAAPGVVTMPLLAATGFSPVGPVAGTVAATVQGTIGNIAAGSVFATVQSAGMGGAGLAAVNGVVQAGGALVGVGAAIGHYL